VAEDTPLPLAVMVIDRLLTKVALLAAFRLMLPEFFPFGCEMVAVTPLGRVLVESVMLPVKLVRVRLTVTLCALFPRVRVTEPGLTLLIAMLEGAVTVRLTVAVCVMPPPAPVTVIVYVPVAVDEATAKVMVEVPEPGAVMDVGLKLTVTPVGWPDADKAIAESKLFKTAVVIVDVPLLPCNTETEVGEAERVKLGVVDAPARAVIRLAPFILPQPVTKS